MARRCFPHSVLFIFLTVVVPLGAGPWRPLFNGTDLGGWRTLGGAAPFTIEGEVIVGTTAASTPNSFLATEETFGDFILELEVKQEKGPSNSGIQFRSEVSPEGRVFGYQCEIDPAPRAWTGGIYDEARRGWLYPVDLNPAAKPLFQPEQWNQIRIEAIGPTLRTWLNGKPVANVIDDLTPRGFIALQVHSVGNPAEAGRRVLWRNVRIQTTDLTPSPMDAIPIRNLLPNDLQAAERRQGWRLLWDGRSAQGWRSATRNTFPERGWQMADGVLSILRTPEGSQPIGGDIVTGETFSAFELQLEFRLTEGANSGIKYLTQEPSAETGGAAVGFEYQLLDDERHPDAKEGAEGNRTLASLYDLIARSPLPRSYGIAPRIGEWQHARILVRADGQVEHWLNGIKVVEYQRGSPDLKARIARSKYAAIAGFGEVEQGRLLLQDHGDEVHFRSIKVREL